MSEVPVVIMTSPVSSWTLGGMFWSLNKYAPELRNVTVWGYEDTPRMRSLIPSWAKFRKIGEFKDYPKNKWSNSFYQVCGHYDYFLFLMDDFWLIRHADIAGIDALWQRMKQTKQVVKIDLATDRLYAAGGTKYLYGANTVAYEKHLDIIRSEPGTPYHMSLWVGLFNADLLRHYVLVPKESAQDIEVHGTARLKEYPELIVLGTRQCPMRVTNIEKSGHGPGYQGYKLNDDWVNGVPEEDLLAMDKAGVELR